MPKTGIATVPLDYGKCPRWLFEKMKKLSRAIILIIREEFGPEEILKRLSDPIWFQSLGCVLGFDYNSSGLTTTTLAALKAGIFDIQDEIGIYICGGKRNSRKTPEEIKAYGISRQFPFYERLIYASKMSAKVDSSLIQDNFQLYHHNFIFTKNGNWVVIQQGMNANLKKARRYHWYSENVKNFDEEPHSGIISDIKLKPLNLTAKESEENKRISTILVRKKPKKIIKDLNLILKKQNSLISQKRLENFIEMEMFNREFYWHSVLKEKFDLKRLEKNLEKANFLKPETFENLLSLKGIGPKTIRALSLVSELIYGAKPSYEDPARYTFSHGGKDGTPYYVDKKTISQTIDIFEKAIKKAKISISEKEKARKRLLKIL